jgi:methionine-rich copper-binding protein CopC
VLRVVPKQIELRFNVRIEQAFARATLREPAREPLLLSPLRSAAAARTDHLILPLPLLKAGSYEVRYHVLAVDGHATQGVLRFRVLP